jgi:ornithine cyclodeaminase/alanine dehydrogenase-like protein (mu-crystallin family)
VSQQHALRYLSAADVVAAMPPLPERLRLADVTLRGLASGADLPPKIGVHPRENSSFAHAMPAFLPGTSADGADDRLGMKWVLGFSGNRERGLPAIHGLVLLNDPQTGVPIAILDAGPITAERTAAVSGVAIRTYAPAATGRPPRAALIGAGVQGRSHLAVLGHLLPGVDLRLFDRDSARAAELRDLAAATPGIGTATVAGSARGAVRDADVVITAASFAPPNERQVMTNDWLAPGALIVPVDYATYCAAEVAAGAAMFLTDHLDQFLANRDAGNFDGYPDPSAMLGEALAAATPRPAGRVVVSHLGTGLADVVFGMAILEAAIARGLGTVLP